MHGVNAFGSLYWSLLAAGVALLIAVVFEIRLALSLGRDPDSRVLSAIVKDFVPPAGRRRVGAAGWAAALAAYQLFPLSQERLFAGNLPRTTLQALVSFLLRSRLPPTSGVARELAARASCRHAEATRPCLRRRKPIDDHLATFPRLVASLQERQPGRLSGPGRRDTRRRRPH